jgi:uncharacterized membrane protein
MEEIFLLILIVVLILVLMLRSKMLSETRYIAGRLDELHKKMDRLSKGAPLEEEPEVPAEGKIEVAFPKAQRRPEPEPIPEREPEPEPIFVPVPVAAAIDSSAFAATTNTADVSSPAEAQTANEPPRQSFFERNPDLEKFIGENLANKIGIGILVIGIGFFVKYAIDQDWINEIGRVFIGIVAGGILLGVAHRMRKTLEAFSSVLVGGGIAVLYLTITIAFQEYHIFNQAMAFIIMVGITGFAVLFSIGYDRRELAVLAILGGFGSPFMVSTGSGNYTVLFSYILILDVGMLVLAYYKKWNIVNIVAYAFTVILFGGWLSTQFDGTNARMIAGAIGFSTTFYLTFFAMTIINNLRERVKFGPVEFGMLLSNTFFYFGAGMIALDDSSVADFRGLFTVVLAVFNFGFAWMLYRNGRVDKNLVFLLIGLVLTFISLAAPIQLHGNYITLFWAAEAVLLLWLSQKSGIRLMKLTSVVVMGLMLISLLMDWEQIYGYGFASETPLNILLNKGYITSLAALASLVLTFRLLKNEQDSVELVNIYKFALTLASVLVLYLAHFLELNYHVHYFFPADPMSVSVVIGTYNMLFIVIALLVEKRMTMLQGAANIFAFLGAFAILLYIAFYHVDVMGVRTDFAMYGDKGTAFLFHYLLVGLLIVICALTIPRIRLLTDFNTKTANAYSWFYVAFFVFIASSELETVVLLIARPGLATIDHILTQTHKIGFPILWGLASFLIIALGLKWKRRHLRIISLTLFLITLLKLFLVDIRGISEGGKIAAFISLGVLLLIVSFMYQRLKRLLLEDTAAAAEQKSTPQAPNQPPSGS